MKVASDATDHKNLGHLGQRRRESSASVMDASQGVETNKVSCLNQSSTLSAHVSPALAMASSHHIMIGRHHIASDRLYNRPMCFTANKSISRWHLLLRCTGTSHFSFEMWRALVRNFRTPLGGMRDRAVNAEDGSGSSSSSSSSSSFQRTDDSKAEEEKNTLLCSAEFNQRQSSGHHRCVRAARHLDYGTSIPQHPPLGIHTVRCIVFSTLPTLDVL